MEMSSRRFDETVLPHLDAAFNYARWLTKNDAEAEDVVQDACVRALRFFSNLRNEDARAWLMAIVRNSWYSRSASRPERANLPLDEPSDPSLTPEARVIQQQQIDRVRTAVESLPPDFREVIVLRELEGLSYKDIAAIAGVPIGTVMSRLSRARERLLVTLGNVEHEVRS